MRALLSISFAALLGLVLVGCQSETAEVADPKALAADSPAEAVERIAAELKADNVLGALQASMPPAAFAEVEAAYEKSRKEVAPEAERAEFAANMVKLTADNAEAALMAELEPLLVKYETEMAAQLPMFLAMGRGYATQWLQEEKTLSEDEKKQATQMIDAVAKWLDSVNFADRKLAGQAIGRIVATARALEVKTVEDLQKLNFQQAMGKAGIISAGIKDVLAIYGLKINEALASVKSSVVSQEGDAARISVAYTFFGQTMSSEADMAQREGRWYGKDSLAKLDASRTEAAAKASAADATESVTDDNSDFAELDDEGQEESTEPESKSE